MNESDKAQSTQRKPLKGIVQGRVNSDKADKTRKVVVEYLQAHPKYGKYVRRRTVCHVHDENNESKQGDIVQIAPCRPVSKNKSWRLLKIVEKAPDQVATVTTPEV